MHKPNSDMLVVRTAVVLLVCAVRINLGDNFAFRNPNLPWEVRVNDLVGRLTLQEVVLQLARGGTGANGEGNMPGPGIPRLGVGAYSWNAECLNGDVGAGLATSFPQPIGMAASFSRDVIYTMAETTAIEVRAKYYDYISRGMYGNHRGLSCFSPVINIMRHPLWGRNQETYGEDPFLSGELAVQYVKGLQGNHSRFIRASAGCKHFDVHSGPENIPVERFGFEAMVTERDWRMTYQPAFKACVGAGSYNIMCSYNSINGVPACANHKLLTEILRNEWNFTGYVISDQDAVEYIYQKHHYLPGAEATAVACIKAGMNLELNTDNPNNPFMTLVASVAKGYITEHELREAAKPLFMTRMRLGEFDPPETNPYVVNDLSVLQSEEHRDKALNAAVKTFVLLKNKNGALPLAKQYNQISIVGPMADNARQQMGQYTPDLEWRYISTPLTGLRGLSNNVNSVSGCNDNLCDYYDSNAIKEAVAGSEVVFVCLGTGPQVECEGNDRALLKIPGEQETLLKDALEAASNTATVVLLLFNGGPVEIDSNLLDKVDAIVECFLPAQSTGEAVYKVLTGDANPAARLPYTWPKSMEQVPAMIDYSMQNRTYRYWFQDAPLYPFGYGLSYTTFEYSDLSVTPVTGISDRTVTVNVANTGSVDGDEVVQVYAQWNSPSEPMPKLQLVEFDRVSVPVGKKVTITKTIPVERFAIYTDAHGFKLQPGDITIYVGGQQPDQKTDVGSNVLKQIITIDDCR